MHADTMARHVHAHVFLGAAHARNERKTWLVIALCAVMMVAEIGGGMLFNSLALVADGLHMSTHAAALLIAAAAYTYARRHAHDARFAFGTGKLGELAAFSSAIILAMIAILIGYDAVLRLVHPVPIDFDSAIPVAVLGLAVNIASAWLLRDDHDHGHDHGHAHADHATHDDHAHDDHDDHHDHPHAAPPPGGHDLNLRAAYVHVAADAAVSVLAIVGLLAGRQFGLLWMDAVMGLIGAAVIGNWSLGLVRAAGAVLLDMRPDAALDAEIRHRLEAGSTDRVSDLHLWRVGPGHTAAIVALVADHPVAPSAYKARLADLPGLSHVTVEVEPCPGHHD